MKKKKTREKRNREKLLKRYEESTIKQFESFWCCVWNKCKEWLEQDAGSKFCMMNQKAEDEEKKKTENARMHAPDGKTRIQAYSTY